MNKSELIDCFNAISPTDEQKEKMLVEVLKYKEKSFKPAAILKYGAAFAAVLVFGIFLSIYSQLKNFDKEERAQEAYYYDSGQYNTKEKVKPDGGENSEDKQVSSEKQSKRTVTDNGSVESKPVLPEESTGEREQIQSTQEQNMHEEEIPKAEELNNAKEETPIDNSNEDVYSSVIPENEVSTEQSQTDEELRLAENYKASGGGSESRATTIENEFDEEVNTYSDDADASDSVLMKAIGSPEDSKTELTKDEIMQDEVYNKLFPKQIISGYRFAFAQVYDDSMLVAVFESDNGYMYIKIFSSQVAGYSGDTVSPEKLKDYTDVEHILFNLLCGDYIVSYEISGENIKGIYDMVVSSDYFNK